MVLLIHELIEIAANQYPDKTAVRAGELEMSYRQLIKDSYSLARLLTAMGLAPGDRLAILLPNSIDLAVLFIAASTAGLVIVPLPPFYARLQHGHILSDSQPRALIVAPDLLDHVPAEALAMIPSVMIAAGSIQDAISKAGPVAVGIQPRRLEQGPDPVYLLAYTSGTTGHSKGVVQTQLRLVERIAIFVRALSLSADDSTIACFNIGRPMNLVFSFLAMLGVGGTVTLLERFDGELFWQAYDRAQPTYGVLRPSSLRELMSQTGAAAADHSRLRFWITGGDMPSEEVHRQVLATTGRPLINMYGATEVGFLSIEPSGNPMKPSSIGRPMETAEMKLVDADGREVDTGHAGKLLARTAHMMLGYWNSATQTPEPLVGGWFDTQDLVRVDEEGCFWFMGRTADLILRDGMKVASNMIVEGLTQHPTIAEVVVVGIRNDRVGQLPVAFYRLAPGAEEEPTQEALRSWIADWVDAMSIPVWFHPIGEWPWTSEGKIDRRRLIELAEASSQVYEDADPIAG